MQRIDGVLHIENDQRLGFCWQLMRRALLFIGKLKLVAIFSRQCLIVSTQGIAPGRSLIMTPWAYPFVT